jgi:two-component system OmpR family sensor kinase
VRDQVDRLGKLATQLLDLTRLESGAVELSATPTDLGVLVRAVTAEFGPALSQHGSQMVLRIPPVPVRVTCDGERVGQLLRILIDNALAHTPSGTNVVVSAESDENGGGGSLAVSDSGPGIPEEAISRVFEPFYSADGARGAAHERGARDRIGAGQNDLHADAAPRRGLRARPARAPHAESGRDPQLERR